MSDTAPRKRTLRELRNERGITRERLAVDLGVSFSTLTNIETGRSSPRIALAERIYQYFGLPVGSIEWGRSTAARKRAPKATPVAA